MAHFPAGMSSALVQARWRSAARPVRAAEENGAELHGISAFGDLKYPADFKNFDYVNVARPQRRSVFDPIPSTRAYNQSYQTFNSLNSLHPQG